MADVTTARIDAWLWAVRLYKTRSAATAACRAGHVRLNGERVKAAQNVRAGDEIRIRVEGFDRVVVVVKLFVKRVGAPVAAEAMTDLTPPKPPREERFFVPVRDRGTGRPTKRDRRDIDRLRSEFDQPLDRAFYEPGDRAFDDPGDGAFDDLRDGRTAH